MSGAARRVLIVGASGFCGRAAARALAEGGAEVLAHLRPGSARRALAEGAWGELAGEGSGRVSLLERPWGELLGALPSLGLTAACSFLGTTRAHARRGGGGYEEVDYGLNASLIEALAALPAPPLFVYLSAQGVEWARYSAYLDARARVEGLLEARALPCVVFRPGLLHDETRDERRAGEELAAGVSRGAAAAARALGARALADRLAPLTAREVGLATAAAVGRFGGEGAAGRRALWGVEELRAAARA